MVFVARARREKMLARRAISSFGKGMFVYACQQLEDFHVKARCYRFLRKSEEPHFLAVIKCDGRAEVFKEHCSCKGRSGGHCNHIFALVFQLNDYSC